MFFSHELLKTLVMAAIRSPDSQNATPGQDGLLEHLPRLQASKNQLAGTLSGGEQQMLTMVEFL